VCEDGFQTKAARVTLKESTHVGSKIRDSLNAPRLYQDHQ